MFTEKTGLTIPLAPGPRQMMAAFPAKLRSQINKGIKNGLTWDIGGTRLLPAFYKVFARNMRDLGSPVHALRFLNHLFGLPGTGIDLHGIPQGDAGSRGVCLPV